MFYNMRYTPTCNHIIALQYFDACIVARAIKVMQLKIIDEENSLQMIF